MASRVYAPAPERRLLSQQEAASSGKRAAAASPTPDRVITPRLASVAALDGQLSAHAVRHTADSSDVDQPTAPLAHRPSLVRFHGGAKRSPAVQTTKRRTNAGGGNDAEGAMAGFHAIQADTEALEMRMERRRKSLLSTANRRESSPARAGASLEYTVQPVDSSASYDFDDFLPSPLDEEKGDSEARRKKPTFSSSSTSTATAPQPILSSSLKPIVKPVPQASPPRQSPLLPQPSPPLKPVLGRGDATNGYMAVPPLLANVVRQKQQQEQQAAAAAAANVQRHRTPPPASTQTPLDSLHDASHDRGESYDFSSASAAMASGPPVNLDEEEKVDRESSDRPIKTNSSETIPPLTARTASIERDRRATAPLNTFRGGPVQGVRMVAAEATSVSARHSPEGSPRTLTPDSMAAEALVQSKAGQAFSFPVRSSAGGAQGGGGSVGEGGMISPTAQAKSVPSSPAKPRTSREAISLNTPSSSSSAGSAAFPTTTPTLQYSLSTSTPIGMGQNGLGSPTNVSQSVPSTPQSLRTSLTTQPQIRPSAGPLAIIGGASVPTRPMLILGTPSSTTSRGMGTGANSSPVGGDKYAAAFGDIPLGLSGPSGSPNTPSYLAQQQQQQQSYPLRTPTGSMNGGGGLNTPTTGSSGASNYLIQYPTSISSAVQPPLTARGQRSNTRSSASSYRGVSFAEGSELVRLEQQPLQKYRAHNRGGVRSILKVMVPTQYSSTRISQGANSVLTPSARLHRHHASLALDHACIRSAQAGAVWTKYNSSGKPQKRWFYVEESEEEWKLRWEGVKGRPEDQTVGEEYTPSTNSPTSPSKSSNGGDSLSSSDTPAHRKASSSSGSLLPFFQIGRWKFNQERERSLIEVTGIHYGPYYSVNFCSFLDQLSSDSKDGAGKPWLCFSIQFRDRTIDLMAADENQVTRWFLALQALAPLSVFHMRRPMILWQRLIMKLNWFGLKHLRRVLE